MADTAAQISAFELLTAPSEPAALASIRITGPRTRAFALAHLRPASGGDPSAGRAGRVRRAAFCDADGAAIDDVLVSFHAGDQIDDDRADIRVHFHGGPWPIGRCRELLQRAGFIDLTGRRDAPPMWPAGCGVQHLAWRMLPRFESLAGARWLARQAAVLPPVLREIAAAAPDDATAERTGPLIARARFAEWFTTPLRIALVGPPNSGKSTLLNALAGEALSLVSDRPGTTRDWVEAPGEIAGYPVVWIDTAGLRQTRDDVESAGIELTREILAGVDAVVLVIDGCDAGAARVLEDLGRKPDCVAANKSDAPGFSTAALLDGGPEIQAPVSAISALTGAGLHELTASVLRACGRTPSDDNPAAFATEIVDALHRFQAGDAATLHALLAEG